MTPTRITIIGMGPRGLSILERLAQMLHAQPLAADLLLEIVEPGECGPGSHPAHQPDHLLTNTVASQVSIFAPDSIVAGKEGISLTQWARMVGYRRFGTRYFLVRDESGDEITDQDHLPRNMLGEYLGWAFQRVVRYLPRNVRIEHHRRRAVDVARLENGAFQISLDSGFQYRADYLFIATGHGVRAATESDLAFEAFAKVAASRNPKAAFFANPYPIQRLDSIASGATVAVQGLGLTAYDVISALTVGRGGQFTVNGGRLAYASSGREPTIVLFSRNCLPFAARGVNQKGIAGRHQARFFTVDAVKAMQARAVQRSGSHQLDFAGEVLPLIEQEMAYAWRTAAIGHAPDVAGFEATLEEREAIRRILDPLAGKAFQSFAAFRAFFRDLIESDLAQAEKGNLTSPVKAATDVLRDCREALRLAVEFGGLTPASNKDYVEGFVATTNRISFGPPRRRNAELLALMDAGVLDVAGAPGNRVELDVDSGRFAITNRLGDDSVCSLADVLVIARLDPYSPDTDSSVLTKNLVRRGLVRAFANGDYRPGGLDITPDLNVINVDGEAQGRLWALGFPVEGPHFYTHALPRPLMNSRFTQDAERCVSGLLRSLRSLQATRDAAPSTARPEQPALEKVE